MTALSGATHPTDLVPGSAEAAYEVAHLAAERERVASDLVDRLLKMREIDGWTGQAAEAYANRVASVARRWTEIGDGLSAVIDPLQTYARALSSAQGLAAQAIEAWAFASSLPEAPGGLSSFARAWPVLVSDPRHRGPAPSTAAEARARAEAMVADACADVRAAGEVATAAVRRAVDAVRARGEVWAEVGEGLGMAALPPGRVLAVMRAVDADALTDLLGARPDLLRRLAEASPVDIAPWWRSLSPAQQDALIASAPGVIGNLGGVAYAARDRANRIVLSQALVEARNSPWDQSEQVAALEALETASRGRTLASLVLDRPPLAQVAVGDLDTASYVSVIVPGMNTSIANSVQSYAVAAEDMRFAQSYVSGVATSEIAVLAWLGYHPPTNDAPLEVFEDARARSGAHALAKDLEALSEVRTEASAFSLTAIGHSYGTDVLTLALQSAGVDHVALLGSAGVADEVSDAAALRVPAGEVYATQSTRDGWAPIGQYFSGRVDPTADSFNAHVFTSEAATIDGKNFAAVGRHGPFGDGVSTLSYLDPNASAQQYTSMIAMGRGHEIPEWGNPDERDQRRLVEADKGRYK